MTWVGDVHGGAVAAQRAPTSGVDGGQGGRAHECEMLSGPGTAGAGCSGAGAARGGRDGRGVARGRAQAGGGSSTPGVARGGQLGGQLGCGGARSGVPKRAAAPPGRDGGHGGRRPGRSTVVTPGFRRPTECEPCTCQDQQFTYTAVT
jgi:hypothetical protein